MSVNELPITRQILICFLAVLIVLDIGCSSCTQEPVPPADQRVIIGEIQDEPEPVTPSMVEEEPIESVDVPVAQTEVDVDLLTEIGWPDYVPVMPGFEIAESTRTEQGDAVLVMKGAIGLEQVVVYYRDTLEPLGWHEVVMDHTAVTNEGFRLFFARGVENLRIIGRLELGETQIAMVVATQSGN